MNNSRLCAYRRIVFGLVAEAFANIYLTQPVLPILKREFSADMVQASFRVSAVILGIALSKLPHGFIRRCTGGELLFRLPY